MWRNLKFPSICVQFMAFCCILNCFVSKFVFFGNLRCFVAKLFFLRFTRFCVEKILAKNSVRGEKMTNMRYGNDFWEQEREWLSPFPNFGNMNEKLHPQLLGTGMKIPFPFFGIGNETRRCYSRE